MKKAFLLLSFGVLAFAACQKIPADATLEGKKVAVEAFSGAARKIFILNEGSMGANNATLDLLRMSDGLYITAVFKKMNPSVQAGLGDVGNDIAVRGSEVWMVINNSGLVEVISAEDEKEIAAIEIPMPRGIAFDGNYAYVSSWAGAFYVGDYDGNGDWFITDSANPKGRLYRIDLNTYKVDGYVEVGYQPEGVAVSGGKIYVANSGGISSQLPPLYSYDDTVSIIDAASFKVSGTVKVQINLKNVYADSKGNVYVTTLGNYYDIHSGLYRIDPQGKVSKVADYVSVSAPLGDTVYCMGTDTEYDWGATSHTYKGFTVNGGAKADWNLSVSATALYSLCAVDAETFLVGDADDYFNPGSVACYNKGSRIWSANAGVCPGHFAIWK